MSEMGFYEKSWHIFLLATSAREASGRSEEKKGTFLSTHSQQSLPIEGARGQRVIQETSRGSEPIPTSWVEGQKRLLFV